MDGTEEGRNDKDSDTEERRRKWYGTEESRRAFEIPILNITLCIRSVQKRANGTVICQTKC
jgi:hypothetical protein